MYCCAGHGTCRVQDKTRGKAPYNDPQTFNMKGDANKKNACHPHPPTIKRLVPTPPRSHSPPSPAQAAPVAILGGTHRLPSPSLLPSLLLLQQLLVPPAGSSPVLPDAVAPSGRVQEVLRAAAAAVRARAVHERPPTRPGRTRPGGRFSSPSAAAAAILAAGDAVGAVGPRGCEKLHEGVHEARREGGEVRQRPPRGEALYGLQALLRPGAVANLVDPVASVRHRSHLVRGARGGYTKSGMYGTYVHVTRTYIRPSLRREVCTSVCFSCLVPVALFTVSLLFLCVVFYVCTLCSDVSSSMHVLSFFRQAEHRI